MANKYYLTTVSRRKSVNNNVRFENFGFVIKRKINQNKNALVYNCLLTETEITEISKFKNFLKITSSSKSEVLGDVYEIYCDSGVYNHGKDPRNDDIKASAIVSIIYKNGTEIHRVVESFNEFVDNNIMEVFAFIRAVRYLTKSISVRVLKNSKIIASSDSQILQEFIIKKTAIQNVLTKCNNTESKDSTFYTTDMIILLKELNYYINILDIYSRWIKGHSKPSINNTHNTKMNIECDTICRKILKTNVSKYRSPNIKKSSAKKEKKEKRKQYYREENNNVGFN